ncbi:translation initiation factor IF-2 [uncultured Selenomonas sp.]|uniref:translation initiation factor IF-2 n=1 Tax=uncultured Selenomonas sp. TaxID=159275 RepID=UPI0028EBA6BF|nr:translation initiation factor IF-2 [uncultured Selenomonas sp.]
MSESKYRITDLAKEFKTDKDTIIDILKSKNYKVKNMFSAVGEEERAAVKAELGRAAKPVRKESLQSKSPAPKAAERPAKKEKRPVQDSAPQTAAPEKKAEQPSAEKAASPAPAAPEEKSVLRARTKAPGIVIVRQAPAKTRSESQDRPRTSGSSTGGAGNRPSRPAGGRGGARPAAGAAIPPPPQTEGRSESRRRGGGRGGDNSAAGSDRGRSNRGGGRRDREERTDLRQNERGRGGARKGRKGRAAAPAPVAKVEIARPKHIKLPETIAVKDLASKMSYTAADIIKKLMLMGVMASINQEIDYDTASLVAAEFGVTTEELPPDVDPTLIPEIEDDPKTLKDRPPVVTVMGHVDHGKTSLLDAIRNTSVSSHEAGGITQHIGAYQVVCQGKKIVFLDTPGHEAFTAMRARGAQITDVAILVVAADDGVMPQTVEAIDHAKSAGVPIIIAINKIDKPGANPDRVKQELMEYGLVSEEYGGDTIMVPVSAKQRIGIDDLLENILLVAEVEELKANPNREARGVIIEAKLDKGRGSVATVLVQSGTLRIGDSIVVGTAYGHVRAMINDRGDNVKKAGPSMPVEILGLNDVPSAGDILAAVDEKQARSIAEARLGNQRRDLIKSKSVSLDALFQQIQQGDIKDLNIVVKADVQGSVEALNSALLGLNKNDEVRVSIVHSGVGAVSESDIMLATASKAIVIAFNVRPDANARRLADMENVDIRTYRVIYDALNDVKDAMSGMLKPKYKEVIQGRVEIRQVMRFSKALVAGSYVLEGKIHNNSKIRILRDNVELFDGEIDSLRRFKDEVKEVAAGYECGISIVDFRDFTEGDIIEAYTMEEIETSIAEANKAAEQKREAQAAAAAAAAASEEKENAE